MKQMVRSNILNVKPYTPGKPIEEVQRELGLKDVVKLASNENALGPSPKALDARRKNLKKVNRYPDACSFYLKRGLAAFLEVKEENLVIGNGSDEIIVLATKAFVEKGDEVVMARPTFLIYEIAAQIQDARIKFVPLTKALKYDLKAIASAVTANTKLVFIANPDNPTGTYVTRQELEDFLNAVPSDTMIFLDEAYFEFANYAFKDYPNGLDYLDRKNVIVGRSFSKAYGLAGLRIGYGIAGNESINYMERVREPFNVNLLAQSAAVAALEDRAFLKKTLKYCDAQKRVLYKAFDRMKLEYVRSATNFILINIERDCKDIFNKLLKEGVIVRDMKAWGLDTYIRVTIGTAKENRKFVAALKKII